MDSHSSASGMRVLLAANKTSVCNATSKVLRSIGYAVTTCTSQKKAIDLLNNQSFDIVVAEAKPSNPLSDSVDCLQLLGKEASPPIIVAMNTSNKAAVDDAIQRGASEVIGLPMNKQVGQLETLWRHALWKNGSSSCATSSKTSSVSDFDFSDLMSHDSHQDNLNINDFLIEPLDCSTFSQYQCSEDSADEMVEDCFKLVEASDLLTGPSEALPHEAAACGMLTTLETAAVGEKRSLASTQPVEAVPAMVSISQEGSGVLETETPEEKKGKRAKVEWTNELHSKFVQAVETLGKDKAVPSRILEHMGVSGSGLTRQNIASHLQKYRSRKTRSRKSTRSAGSTKATAAATSTSVAPAFMQPNGSMPMVSLSASGLQVVSGMPVQSSAGGQQQWVQMWSALPQGAVLCNHLGQPLLQQPPGVISSSVPSPAISPFPSGPSVVDIQKAIKDVLSQPQTKGPLGLHLDTSNVIEGLKLPAPAAAC